MQNQTDRECPCFAVQYAYVRDRMPRTKRWYLNVSRDPEPPEMMTEGDIEVVRDTGDEFVLIIAVPAGDDGQIAEDVQARFEDTADAKFRELKPGHELA